MLLNDIDLGVERDALRQSIATPLLKNEVVALLQFVRRRYRFILVGIAVGFLVLGAYSFVATPIYKATVQISLDPRNLQVLQTDEQNSRATEAPLANSARVDTLVETVQSDAIVGAVVRELELTKDDEYNGTRSSFFRALLTSIVGHDAPPSEEELRQRTIANVQLALIVDRPAGTYLVNVGVMSESPEKAARIANVIGSAYLSDQLKSNNETTKAASAWMRIRLKELGAETLKADGAVMALKSASGLATADGRSIADTMLQNISDQLSVAKAATAEKKAKFDQIEKMLQSDQPDQAVTDALSNDVIISLRKQYLDTVKQMRELAGRYGETHSAVLKLKRDADSILQSLRGELKRIEETYRNEYQISQARESALRVSLDQQFQKTMQVGEVQVQLKELESTAAAARLAYQDMLRRYTDAVQKQSFPVVEARVLGNVTAPTERFKPKRIVLMAIGAAVGLFAGLGTAIAVDMTDKQIRTRREAEEATGVDCFGMFPIVDPRKTRAPATFLATANVDFTKKAIPWDYVSQEPFSVGAEVIRSAKVAIDHQARVRPCKVIGIVSSLPNEGKTTVSVSLAHLIADTGGRVLLIDSDLRHPAMTRILHPSCNRGLPDVLLDGINYREVLVPQPDRRLDFLPSISTHAVSQSNELVGSDAMQSLLAQVSRDYDYVIVDLPPLLPVVDVRAVATFIDAFILVIGWGQTPREVLQDAMSLSDIVRDKLLGSILNKVKLSEIAKYGEYTTSYYSSNYHRG